MFKYSKLIRDGDKKVFGVKENFHWTTIAAEDGEEDHVKIYGPEMYVSDTKGVSYKEAKYVILEGLKQGNRFYSSFDGRHDARLLKDGREAYKVLGYTLTGKEAQDFLTNKPGWIQI